MSSAIKCPHCQRKLRVTEAAFGKTVSCPGCNQPIQVATPTDEARQPPPPGAPNQDARGMPDPPSHLPPGMPPIPPSDQSPNFAGGIAHRARLSEGAYEAPQPLNITDVSGAGRGGGPRRWETAGQRFNIRDMFFGNEREHVFTLLPGEKPLDELHIHHQRLFIVKSGTTRVTLTTHRLLYTATRVFSPAYWLLLVVFGYPLLFYYFFRLSRNRNVALPLGSIDSFEKRYRPNWLWFVLAILAAPIVGYSLTGLVGRVLGTPESLESWGAAFVSQFIVQCVVWALLAVGTLMLLLATRIVGYDVRSKGNNSVSIRYSPGDLGVSEGRFDAFFQNVHVQMERTKVLQPPAGPGS